MAGCNSAFALTGRVGNVRHNPGRCPGLGASALTGRAGRNVLQGVLDATCYRACWTQRVTGRAGRNVLQGVLDATCYRACWTQRVTGRAGCNVLQGVLDKSYRFIYHQLCFSVRKLCFSARKTMFLRA